MKRYYVLICVLLFAIAAQAQSVDVSEGLIKKNEYQKVAQKVKKKKGESGGTEALATSDTSKKDSIDVLIRPRVMIFGLTSLNNSNNDVLNSLNGTGRIGATFFLAKSGKVKLTMGVNMLNAKPPKGVSRDSVDFNSLMFPETGNFGFLLNPSVRLTKFRDPSEEHTLWAEAFFAYRKVSIDSPNISFKSLVYNLGLKYQWKYKIDDEHGNIIFTVMPYWSYFNIPDEDVTRFNLLLNDPLFEKVNKKAGITAFGAKSTMQYKNFLFFFDLRYNNNTKRLNDDNPLKGTKVNIGFVTAFSLKQF